MAEDTSSSSTSGTTATNDTIDRYVEQARKRKALLTASKSAKMKKSSKEVIEEKDDSPILLPIGSMYHCERRGRGIHTRGGTLKNVLLKGDCTYERMLSKCVQEIYPDVDQERYEFYIADSRGAEVWNGDKIDDDGEECNWTLMNYIKLSRIKFPSKARFFCVKKEKVVAKCIEVVTDQSETQTTEEPKDEDKPFELYFMLRKRSRYRKSWSLMTLTQHRALYEASNDYDKHVYESESADNPNGLLVTNPLHMDNVFLERIWVQGGKEIDFLDTSSNDVVYKEPDPGAPFEVWTGGYGCPNSTHIAVLACVGINGYHSKLVYQWYKNSECLVGEDFPILYSTSCGKFKCQILYKGKEEDYYFKISDVGNGPWQVDVGEAAWQVTPSKELVVKESSSAPIETESPIGVEQTLGSVSTEETPCVQDKAHDSTADEYNESSREPIETGSLIVVEQTLGSVSTEEVTPVKPVPCVQDKAHECTADEYNALRNLKDLTRVSLADTKKVVLLDRIGQGTFGTVYMASWRGSIVAAKVIPTQKAEMKSVKSEIHVQREVHHPNLSSCLGVVDVPEGIAILSPLVKGDNLHNCLFASEKKFSYPEKLYISIQVCQAVVYLHECNLMHLDIKPANILVESQTLKTTLTDFGLSQAISNTTLVGTKTMMSGSPGYQAPEQLRAESLGLYCDVYAFGCVLIVLFREKVLWQSLNQYQILCKVSVEKSLPEMEGLKPGIMAICKQALLPMSERPSIITIMDLLLNIAKDLVQ